MFLTFSVDLENGRLNATSSLQKEWQHTKGRMQKVAMQEAESDRIKRFGSAHFAAKMHPNFMKIMQKPSKIHPKLIKMVPRSDPKATLEIVLKKCSAPDAFLKGFLC